MITFETKYLRYSIDEAGNNVEFTDKSTGRNYLKSGMNPCGRLVRSETDRTEVYPTSASYDAPYLTVTYTGGIQVRILAEQHEDYITFALESVSNQDIWSVCVTLIDVDIDYDHDSSFVASLLGMSLNTHMQEYPGRDKRLMSEAFTHIGLPGVKSAVIGAPETVLNPIMRKVVDEIPDGAMPKSAYSGPYASDCPYAEDTYTIRSSPLTSENIDAYIEKLKKFGITQISMHQGSMYSQGDFTVNPLHYPNGIEDYKAIIKKLHDNGIKSLLHSYTFFVQQYIAKAGNKYLAPKPHKDIDVCARFTLSADITPDADFIPTTDDTSGVSTVFGWVQPASNLLWIDDEIIRFAGVSDHGFTKIERGVFGSTVSEHKAGSEVKQINSYFTYIAPKKGSELFYEIARNTADFYNECDFDGFYLDAIDGVFVLDGNEFSWYHAVDFINEMFKYLKKPPIFNCCYGPQYPGQWYARTRMGAFDHPNRGYRDFVDAHAAFNEQYAERMYLIGEHGWWQIYPGNLNTVGFSDKIMFDEDLEYLCSKILASNVCQCWSSSFERIDSIPLLERYAERIRLYDRLKKGNYFPKTVKDMLKKPSSEFELIEADGEYKFRPAHTDFMKFESFEDGRNVTTSVNGFAAQAPRIRIEPMMTAEAYDSENAQTIWAFDENEPVKFDEPIELNHLDTDGKLGLGVWIRGDGKGETVCIRLKSPANIQRGNSDHYIKVDFTGWRYYSFYEFMNCEMKPEDWPVKPMEYKVYTDVRSFYAVYTSPVSYKDLESINILVNKPGDYDIRLRPIVSVPEHELVLCDPTLSINGQKITFKTALRSKTYLEYDPVTGFTGVYDYSGNLLETPSAVGSAPIMNEGENTVELTADCDSPYLKRAAVTLRTYGKAIDNK